MKLARLYKFFICIVFVFTTATAVAQTSMLPNAFSHNDYRHKRPLMDALNHGFRYVEADIYLRKGKLIVAHILPRLKMNRTLESLYLQPLLEYVQHNEQQGKTIDCPLTLMIDIKSDADDTYRALLVMLEKYKPILSRYNSNGTIPGNVTIVISGHKPSELIANMDSGYVFMDDNLRQIAAYNCTELYPMASCKYSRLLKWKGKGAIPPTDILRLEFYVAQAHKLGRKVRLWASPENKVVWNELLKYNVDLINTNRLTSLRKFLTGANTSSL
ncbi:MAG: phosphatidylinositol-specific phospholipase C/glycerophosphodiester phosphodiesterase family protein [Ferruginibacter sp.]